MQQDEGKPLKTSAEQFDIPQNTLRNYWLKKQKLPGSFHLGRESILGPPVKKDLVEYNLMLEDRGFRLTPANVWESAFDYTERNNNPHSFDKEPRISGIGFAYNTVQCRCIITHSSHSYY